MIMLNNNPDNVYRATDYLTVGTPKVVDKNKLKTLSMSISSLGSERLVDEIKEITDFGVITPIEKKQLKYEYESIVREYAQMVQEAVNVGYPDDWSEEQIAVFTAYSSAYTAFISLCNEILADMTINYYDPSERLSSLAETYYSTAVSLYQLILDLRYALMENAKLRMLLDCNPYEVPLGGSSTVSVRILMDSIDITDQYEASCFTWNVYDSTNVLIHTYTGMKSITVSYADSYGGARVDCTFTYTS